MSDEKNFELNFVVRKEEKTHDDILKNTAEIEERTSDSIDVLAIANSDLTLQNEDDSAGLSDHLKHMDNSGVVIEDVENETISSENLEEESVTWYAPLGRASLVDLLAGGVLAPYGYHSRSSNDLQFFSIDGILLIKNGLSQDILDAPDLVGTKGFTVLVEVDFNSMPDIKLKGINAKGQTRKVLMNDANQSMLLLYPAIIPGIKIKAIHFRSESDKRNFVSRRFENVPMEKRLLKISEELFCKDFPCDMGNIIKGLKKSEGGFDLKASYMTSDSYVGSAALLISTLPAKKNWLEFSKEVLTQKGATNLFEKLLSKVIEGHLDRELFKVTFSLMQNMDTSEGWQSKNFLKEIYDALKITLLKEDEKEHLDMWYKACDDILNNKRNITPLTDQKMKVGRAILLLLLRPEPDAILDSQHSSLEPGEEVRAIAAMLSGVRFGFEELPNSIKLKTPMHELLTCLKADISNAAWGKSILNKHVSAPIVDIEISDCGNLANSYKLLIDKTILVENRDEGPIELRLIHTKGESVGIKLRYERGSNRLSYQYSLPEGRFQTVFVSPGEPTENNERTIRFSSPCLDISTSKGRKLLNKEMYRALLIKNCDSNLYCRFAISEDEKMVFVLSDQLLDTIDNNELEMGLEHVAKTADAFEKEMGLDEF